MPVRRVLVPVPEGAGEPGGRPRMDPRRVLITVLMNALVLAYVGHQMYMQGTVRQLMHVIDVHNPWGTNCGLLSSKDYLLTSDHFVQYHIEGPGFVHVRGEQVVNSHMYPPGVNRTELIKLYLLKHPKTMVLDYDSAYIAPGLVDLHAHLNEPGRESWEGFETGTRAAAAGGVTSLVDMPLNSHPAVTSATELKKKLARSRQVGVSVDVGFWGGIVPDNAGRPGALRAMRSAGAIGFKSFMSPSGMEDFPNVSPADVARALPTVKALGVPFLIHLELVDDDVPAWTDEEVGSFDVHVARRPERFEHNAIAAVIDALRADRSEARPGFYLHVVHVSSASSLELIDEAKREGLPIRAETCPHYLLLAQEDVPDSDPRYKCMPPIRGESNRAALVAALAEGRIDTLATDHSPAPREDRRLDDGNVRDAWGGIAGLQYALPASWEPAVAAGPVSPSAFVCAWSHNPAEIASLAPRKGDLFPGSDADIVVFDASALADTTEASRHHKHKDTVYDGMKLRGKVLATFVRGHQVFDANLGVTRQLCGRVLTT